MFKNDGELDLVEVSFCGSASPEGSAGINRRLAEERRAAVESYVRGRISLPDSIITRCDGSIAWERLASLVEQSDMPTTNGGKPWMCCGMSPNTRTTTKGF